MKKCGILVLIAITFLLFLSEAAVADVITNPGIIEDGECFVIGKGDSLTIGKDEKLILESGACLRIESGGSIFLESKSNIELAPGSSMDIHGKITNYGKIKNYGTINNYGLIVNYERRLAPGIISNYGTINDYGIIKDYSVVNGDISNQSKVDADEVYASPPKTDASSFYNMSAAIVTEPSSLLDFDKTIFDFMPIAVPVGALIILAIIFRKK